MREQQFAVDIIFPDQIVFNLTSWLFATANSMSDC